MPIITTTWTTNSGDWFTANDWSLGLPNSSSITVIAPNQSSTITYDPASGTDTRLYSLAASSAVTLQIIPNTTLEVLNGNDTFVGGSLQNSGVFRLSGSHLTVDAQISNSGTLLVSSTTGSTATLEFNSFTFSAVGTIDVGLKGIGQFDTSVPSAQTVQFVDDSAVLKIAASLSFSAPINGFHGSNHIDFFSTQYNASDTITYAGNATSGRVTVSTAMGGAVASVLLNGNYSQGDFMIRDDGNRELDLYLVGGGTPITLPTPCLCSGTRIATARGEVRVEDLRVGDAVVLEAGGTAPAIWIGQRRIDCRVHPDPASVRPVRVAAGAFGPGRPTRDVHLSPDHAVFLDGALVPVGRLVDGRTVTISDRERFTYWHVELPDHAVMLAEGLPVESYLDRGTRAAFVNAGLSDRAGGAVACAPLLVGGPRLAALRARLAA